MVRGTERAHVGAGEQEVWILCWGLWAGGWEGARRRVVAARAATLVGRRSLECWAGRGQARRAGASGLDCVCNANMRGVVAFA